MVSCNGAQNSDSEEQSQNSAAVSSVPLVNTPYYGIENFRTRCHWARAGDQVRYIGKANGKFRFMFIGNFSNHHDYNNGMNCDITPQEFAKLRKLDVKDSQYSCLKNEDSCFASSESEWTVINGSGSCGVDSYRKVKDCRSAEEKRAQANAGQGCDSRKECCGGETCTPGGDCTGGCRQ